MEQLVTLKQITGNSNFQFGFSEIEVNQIGEGGKHKSARKELRDLSRKIGSLNYIETGPHYIHHTENGNIFMETLFPGNHLFYLNNRAVDFDQIDPEKNIRFIGGTCIGGSTTATGFDSKSHQYFLLESDMPNKLNSSIHELKLDACLSVYEVDTIKKLTGLIDAISSSNNTNKSVVFHIPIPEYLLYILQYYQKGVLSKDQSYELASFIQQRGLGLSKIISTRLQHITNEGEIQLTSPLNFLLDENIFAFTSASFKDIITFLSKNLLWNYVIQSTKPQTWNDLANCSYQVFYLQQAQITSQKANLIGIENPEEMSILLAAKKTAATFNLPLSILCLYPHSFVVTTVGEPRRLYRHQSDKLITDLVKTVHEYKT